MKNIIPLLILALTFAGCQKDSYLRLTTSEVIKELEPAFSQPQRYRYGNDTIALRLISQSSSFEATSGSESGGSLGDFDRVERERRKTVLGSDTPFFRFEFNTITTYNPAAPTRSEDAMEILMQEENAPLASLLKFQFLDSLRCSSLNCQFADTLLLDSVSYINVYSNGIDTNGPKVYINRNEKLAAFKTSGNKTYQRIK